MSPYIEAGYSIALFTLFSYGLSLRLRERQAERRASRRDAEAGEGTLVEESGGR